MECVGQDQCNELLSMHLGYLEFRNGGVEMSKEENKILWLKAVEKATSPTLGSPKVYKYGSTVILSPTIAEASNEASAAPSECPVIYILIHKTNLITKESNKRVYFIVWELFF